MRPTRQPSPAEEPDPEGGPHGTLLPHRPAHAHHRGKSQDSVQWLELLYDLVMVATITVFSHAVAEHPDWTTVLRTGVIFSVLWCVWLSTTLLVDLDPSADAARRGLVFAQIVIIAMLIIVGSHAHELWNGPLAPLIGASLVIAGVMHEVTVPDQANIGRIRPPAAQCPGGSGCADRPVRFGT